ncbi:ribonuclease P protein subunit p21 isoform X2 [Armigeres subalbatus]
MSVEENNHKQKNAKEKQYKNSKTPNAPRRAGNQTNNSNGKKHMKLCPGRDIYERMNFLYQASMLMADTAPALSGNYGKLMKSIGKKATLRIEPAIKRTLCHRCGVALIPTNTAEYSDLRKENLCFVEVTCKVCNYRKRYRNWKGHKIHLEDSNFVIETLAFDTKPE